MWIYVVFYSAKILFSNIFIQDNESCYYKIMVNGYTYRGNKPVKTDFAPSEKGVNCKRKESTLFFPFRVDCFFTLGTSSFF